MTNPLSPLTLLAQIKRMPKGARFEYHRGYLPKDKTGPVSRLAATTLILEEEGFITLTQKKLGFHNYSYMLQRSLYNVREIPKELERAVRKLEAKREL